mgnify:CR=1 FL=1
MQDAKNLVKSCAKLAEGENYDINLKQARLYIPLIGRVWTQILFLWFVQPAVNRRFIWSRKSIILVEKTSSKLNLCVWKYFIRESLIDRPRRIHLCGYGTGRCYDRLPDTPNSRDLKKAWHLTCFFGRNINFLLREARRNDSGLFNSTRDGAADAQILHFQ